MYHKSDSVLNVFREDSAKIRFVNSAVDTMGTRPILGHVRALNGALVATNGFSFHAAKEPRELPDGNYFTIPNPKVNGDKIIAETYEPERWDNYPDLTAIIPNPVSETQAQLTRNTAISKVNELFDKGQLTEIMRDRLLDSLNPKQRENFAKYIVNEVLAVDDDTKALLLKGLTAQQNYTNIRLDPQRLRPIIDNAEKGIHVLIRIFKPTEPIEFFFRSRDGSGGGSNDCYAIVMPMVNNGHDDQNVWVPDIKEPEVKTEEKAEESNG